MGTALTTGGFVEELAQSSVQSLEGIGEGMTLENGIKESVKGGGFKTSAGNIVERPVLGQQELPYLESKIEQETTKQQTKERVTKFLSNRREKLTLKQNELEGMTAKREATIAAEEQRLQAIADEEMKLRQEEEALQRQLLAEKNEAARLEKEAQEARIKQEEEAKIKKEAEEARRIRAEQEAERARIAEAKEQARQEAIAREQRALEVLRQQEAESALQQQRSTASTATAAGINTLREYASKFSSEYYANQLSSNVDKQKIESMLSQLGVSPGLVGGAAAALLALGGGAAAIKNLLDGGDEYDSGVTNGNSKPKKNEDNLTSQVEELLEMKSRKSAQQSSTVKRTLRISEGLEDGIPTQKMQKPQSASPPPLNGATSKNPPPSSIKFGESTSQPVVTPPSPKSNQISSSSQSPRLGAPTGIRNNEVAPSKTTSNPFENNFAKTPSSSSAPPTKKNYSVSSAKLNSFSSSADLPGFGGGPPSKNARPAKSFGTPKSYSSPPKSFGISSGGQTGSPFAKTAEKTAPGKQPASSFRSPSSKSESVPGFGFPPPKSAQSSAEQGSSPFGAMSKQSASPAKKSIPPFNPSGKQAPYSSPKSSPFDSVGSKAGSPKAFGTSVPKTGISPNNFDLSPKKAGGSPFKQATPPVGTGFKQSSPQVQSAPSFGVPPQKGPPGAFGSSMPKSSGSPNGFGSPPKKFSKPPTQSASPFGTPPKQASSTKDLVSPFRAGSSNPFEPPSSSISDQPGQKTNSPFNSSPKSDAVSNKKTSPFAAYGTPQRKAYPSNGQKNSFSPFSQSNGSQEQTKPSFSASGPAYMPPTSKVNNAASLNNVYSSLDKNQKNGIQEQMIREMEEPNPVTTSSPKNSFSPFAGRNGVAKSSFGSPNAVSANVNEPNASLPVSPLAAEAGTKKSFSPYGSQQLVSPQNVAPSSSSAQNIQSRGVKKSYSPYGRKPTKRAETLPPKVDPSSFSFATPSPRDSKDPISTNAFSYEPNKSSTAKPFAATGFPPTGQDLENARNRAMKEMSDGQQKP